MYAIRSYYESNDHVTTLPAVTRKRISYQAISRVGAQLESTGRFATGFYLQVPETLSDRLRATASYNFV